MAALIQAFLCAIGRHVFDRRWTPESGFWAVCTACGLRECRNINEVAPRQRAGL